MENIIQNEVTQAIISRRSIRDFKPDQISELQLKTIINCGFHAPSGMNCQGWYLSVIQNKQLLDEIHQEHIRSLPPVEKLPPVMQERLKNPDYNVFFHAPTVIMVSHAEKAGSLNCGFLGQNMVLTAQSLGLGTCYLGGILQLLLAPEGQPFLDQMKIPDGYSPCFLIAVGQPNEQPAMRERDFTRYVMI